MKATVGILSDIRGTILDIEGSAFREGDVVTFLDVHETCNAWHQFDLSGIPDDVANVTTAC